MILRKLKKNYLCLNFNPDPGNRPSEEYDVLITALEAWDENKLTLRAVKNKLIEEDDGKSIHTSEEIVYWSATLNYIGYNFLRGIKKM